MNIRLGICLVVCFGSMGVCAAEGLSPVLCEKGALLFEADFNGGVMPGEWKPLHGTQWAVEDGVLVGRGSTAEYQKAHPGGHSGKTPSSNLQVASHDMIVQMRFKISGKSTGLHFGFNNGTTKDGTGHCGRVAYSIKGTQLIKDQNTKIEGDESEVLVENDFKLERDKWYTVLLEVKGGEMVAQLSGGPTVRAKHARFDFEKTWVNLPTRGGGEVRYDDVKVWGGK
jgi:hypothetical protein